jgi:hypothetical protein
VYLDLATAVHPTVNPFTWGIRAGRAAPLALALASVDVAVGGAGPMLATVVVRLTRWRVALLRPGPLALAGAAVTLAVCRARGPMPVCDATPVVVQGAHTL